MNELSQITSEMYSDKGIRVKNNPLGLSVAAAQRAFDELALDVVIPAFNSLVNTQNTINTDVDSSISSLTSSVQSKANASAVLSKSNTDAFTPTSDYQPATKRYVDLNVISGGVPQTRTVNGYPLSSDVLLNAADVGALSVNNASGTTPSMNGTGTSGTSINYARADHIHPKDTSKLDVPERITTGTSITLVNNKEYVLTDVSTLTIAYPSGNFECWLKITTAASGTVTVTLPTSSYIGHAPTFSNSETWELSIKDSVIVAQRVGDD
ncbi:MAG: hypothetical protein VB119_11350 [Candidatus Metalachnospira sp.]|nr:hypothetical protein [Candidatus Metalachnospira sp.]